MSCILSPASLVRVIYSFGWHRTSLPVIVSPGFIRLVAFSALQTILSAFGACTVQNLSVTRPQSSPFQIPLFHNSAVRFLSKVTELPTIGLNKQSLKLFTSFRKFPQSISQPYIQPLSATAHQSSALLSHAQNPTISSRHLASTLGGNQNRAQNPAFSS